MTHTRTPWGTWDPATPAAVARLFGTVRAPWWLAGGYAIELALQRHVREHSDIDVLLLRRDQLAVQDALTGWEWWAADPPGTLSPWRRGERLPRDVHDIWCRPGSDQPWCIQVMLDESVDNDWTSRRNPRLRRPVTMLGDTSASGIPYLAPEIQLFYKAQEPRPKDEFDFAAVQPVLELEARRWLGDAIIDTYGCRHPWLRELLPHPQPVARSEQG